MLTELKDSAMLRDLLNAYHRCGGDEYGDIKEIPSSLPRFSTQKQHYFQLSGTMLYLRAMGVSVYPNASKNPVYGDCESRFTLQSPKTHRNAPESIFGRSPVV